MIRSAALALCCMLPGVAGAFSPALQPGLWEITSATEMPGMPVRIPPVTYTECLTNQDPVPEHSEAGTECRVQNVVTDESRVTWDLVCNSPQGTMNSRGEISFDGDRMAGRVTTNMEIPGQGAMQMEARLEGKRLGDCNQ